MTLIFRFWVLYLFFLVLLCCSGVSHAGYYAVVTSAYSNHPYTVQGRTSGCYLTPSMAICQTGYYCNGNLSLTAIDDTAKTFTANYNGGSYAWSGTYGNCEAQPQGGSLPTFVGGVSDPAITADGIVGGSSGGQEEMFNTEVFEYAAGGALLMFAIGFGIGLAVQAIRRLRTP